MTVNERPFNIVLNGEIGTSRTSFLILLGVLVEPILRLLTEKSLITNPSSSTSKPKLSITIEFEATLGEFNFSCDLLTCSNTNKSIATLHLIIRKSFVIFKRQFSINNKIQVIG